MERDGYRQNELGAEVQWLTLLLTDVKDNVGNWMAEDVQRRKKLDEKDEELKTKYQLLKTQQEELVALRLKILEHERKAASWFKTQA